MNKFCLKPLQHDGGFLTERLHTGTGNVQTKIQHKAFKPNDDEG
jgi:hypothetical protein